jgi:hypothetical protein
MSNASQGMVSPQAAWNTAVLTSGLTAKLDYNYPVTAGFNNMIVFKGLVEVERAANGFVVRIGTRQGDIATTYVAKDVSEVNGIITAEMVKFKLEDK